jgi:hypothetical protein
VNAITYTIHNYECAYTNSFKYKVVDPSNGESPESTVSIAASGVNCIPKSTDFSTNIAKTGAINFTTHVSDQDNNQNANLLIKLST